MEEKVLVFENKKGEEFDYNHMIALISFEDDSNYNLKKVTIIPFRYMLSSNEKYVIEPQRETRYPFSTQGNIHILFGSEFGEFFHKSFDGHKGNVYYDSNFVMEELVDFLNKRPNTWKDKKGEEYFKEYFHYFNYELLGLIEQFFNKKQGE